MNENVTSVVSKHRWFCYCDKCILVAVYESTTFTDGRRIFDLKQCAVNTSLSFIFLYYLASYILSIIMKLDTHTFSLRIQG